jgi:hypothetical protein
VSFFVDNNFYKPYTELTIKYYYNGEFDTNEKIVKMVTSNINCGVYSII